MVRFWIFTRQILEILTDRTTKVATKVEPRKLRQNCPCLQKAYISKYSCGRGFWEAGKARIFSRLSSFKGHLHGLPTDNVRSIELEQLQHVQRACARTILRTDNVRSIRGRSDFETWTDQTTKPRKPRNHEGVLKKTFWWEMLKKGFIFKVELWRGWVWFAFWNNVISTIPGSTIWWTENDSKFRGLDGTEARHDDSSYWQRTVDT